MSFRACIRDLYEKWLVQIKASPDPVGCEQLVCPECGEQIVVRWARNSERWMAYHSLTQLWCPHSGAAWYGATRAEAVGNFQKGGDSHATADRSTVEALAAPNVPPAGAATIQGWEVSGLDEEAVNALLTMKEDDERA